MLLVELGEGFPRLRQAPQQRSRRPEFSVLLMEFANALIDLLQPDSIGMPHGAAAIGGKSITVEINNVDVDGTQRESFFENPRSFVYQRINTAIDNFVSGNVPLRNSCFRAPLPHERGHFRIRARTAILVVPVPSFRRLLAVAAKFAKTVFREGLTDPRFFQVSVLLANAPTHIEAGQVTGCQWTHSIAKIDQGFIDGFYLRSFFYEKLSFAPIRAEHAVANETATIPHQHTDFAQLLG